MKEKVKRRKKKKNNKTGLRITVGICVVLSILCGGVLFYLKKQETVYIETYKQLPITAKNQLLDEKNPMYFKEGVTGESLHDYFYQSSTYGKENFLLILVVGHWENKYEKEIEKIHIELGELGIKLAIQDLINDCFISEDGVKAIDGKKIIYDLKPKAHIEKNKIQDLKEYLANDLIVSQKHELWEKQMNSLVISLAQTMEKK